MPYQVGTTIFPQKRRKIAAIDKWLTVLFFETSLTLTIDVIDLVLTILEKRLEIQKKKK